MNVSTPDLLTLLQWSERRAAGEPCAPWDVWCASSTDATWKSKRIEQAQELLRGGCPPDNVGSELSEEELAQFVDGRLASADADRVEQGCWRSPAQLAEILSTLRFLNQPHSNQTSSDLEDRLIALAPPPALQRTNGKPPIFRLSSATAVETPPADAENVVAPPIASAAAAGDQRLSLRQFWPIVAATLLAAIVLSGLAGWFAGKWHYEGKSPPMAHGPAEDQVTPQVQINDEPPPPLPENQPTPIPTPSAEQQNRVLNSLPAAPIDSKPEPPRANPPGAPRLRPRVAPPRPQLAFQSVQGVLLIDVGQRGSWRVASNSHSLDEPVNVLSVAESWSTVDVPGLGRLIWEGNAEASIQMLLDDLVEIRLIHGRFGIERLKADAQIRLLVSDAVCTVRGVDGESTVAVVCDPVSPGLQVVSGAVMVEETELVAGQITRWIDGIPQSPQPIVPVAAAPTGATPLSPPAMNPWDVKWLKPPDDNVKQQWRMIYGRLVERLAAANDVGDALPKLLAATREPRQAALLARWNVAIAAGADKPQKTWDLLGDRRPAVRVAGVKCLMELPPGDERLQRLDQLLVAKVGAATADRIHQWHSSAWLPGAPPKAQADEIVAHLQHNDVAVRQFAVSFLELYTAAAFQQMGVPPPEYDATATASRRAAAQLQWIQIIDQLYSPNRKVPLLTPRQLLNAAPGGT